MMVLPAGQAATVRSINSNGSCAAVALSGNSVDIILQGLSDLSAVGPGTVVCHPQWPVPLAAKLTVRVAVLDIAIPILTGQAVSIPGAAAAEEARYQHCSRPCS